MGVRFGDCELSVERIELRRGGQIVDMEPQVFDVLAYLLRHRERMVPKTELLDQIWGNRFVSESALSSRIKSARRAVGDTGRDQRIIKTVYGRGYRFVADAHDQPISTDPPATGSATPVHQVLRAVSDIPAGIGTAIQISGGPGSGKTELLHQAAEAARRHGLAVGLSAPAAASRGPYACIAEVLEEIAQGYPGLLDAISAGCRTELVRAFDGQLPMTRQRWFVAVREFVVVAAEQSGAVLLLDDLHLAHRETLILVDDLARLTRTHRLAVIIAQRSDGQRRPGFEVAELADRHLPPVDRDATADLPAEVAEVLQRVAQLGDRFDRLEFTAASGHDPQAAGHLLAQALSSGVICVESGEYRFSDPATAARLAAQITPARRPVVMTEIATRLAALGAAPAQVAGLLLAGREPAMAAPHALEAARTAAASGFHAEVLRWTEAVRDHVNGQAEAALLSLRADALAAVGDHAAVPAYRKALAAAGIGQAPGLRARLARAAILSGDLASAEEALAGLEPTGGADDGAILLARGMLAYFSGDIDGADAAVEAARAMALAPGAPNRLLDVITLQGMIAHNRGEWFDRLRRELRATAENPELASAVFDSHLCVAEYLLYGPTPYDEVVTLTRRLREQAERTGARRGVAFAVTVAGEAALLAGDLDAARADLAESLALHVEMGADTGAAHALQRLAEVELAAGDRAAAERLLRRALPLARWSPLARHLLQRIYGTLISAAPDTDAALAVVDEAAERLDEPFSCIFCQVMIAVPASIACTEGGRMDEARSWLAQAERSAATWQGTAWQGAVTEAQAHLVRAEGDHAAASRLLAEAATLFELAGQPLDAQRCLDAADP
ncbi:MAG TPA: winged helix-turn-helix domain-containing protein [Streptosporangiaceae bacterium]|nr:winged helix-turn-helix domain-containing protein [Streptosporangiaceae bacterium]